MRHRRPMWLLLAGVLLVAVAVVGWAAADRVGGDGDDGVDQEVLDQAPDRVRDEESAQPPSASASPSEKPSRPPQDVLYLGDSLAMEAQDILGGWLQRSDRVAGYSSAPVAGVTVCDYLTGRPGKSLVPEAHKAATLVRERRPGVVVLQFWGNT